MNSLLTITGQDAPGITAALTHVLSQAQVDLLDIEQVVIQGQLTLCLLVNLDSESDFGELVLKDLLFCARKLHQELSYRPVPSVKPKKDKRRYVLTVMSDRVTAEVMYQISSLLASHDANIENIRRLSRGELSSLEIGLSILDSNVSVLKAALLKQLSENSVDIALQQESLSRRNKRLVVLDMDSTLIQAEVIDEIARVHGVLPEVGLITHQAMHEGLDFTESLKRRVMLLEGFDVSRLEALVKDLKLTLGARELVRVLKSLGYQIGIISGGFDQAASYLKEQLNLDFAYANKLEEQNGRLTGRVIGPIVDAARKADLLDMIAQSKQIPLDQTIAIGDGANDALMLAKAGLGIAYHAKPILRKSADTTISFGGLERILYLLGIHAREIHEFL
ncbi:MAG: phosphoserine phosphatase SerB [Myxococcaceae bacterium]